MLYGIHAVANGFRIDARASLAGDELQRTLAEIDDVEALGSRMPLLPTCAPGSSVDEIDLAMRIYVLRRMFAAAKGEPEPVNPRLELDRFRAERAARTQAYLAKQTACRAQEKAAPIMAERGRDHASRERVPVSRQGDLFS